MICIQVIDPSWIMQERKSNVVWCLKGSIVVPSDRPCPNNIVKHQQITCIMCKFPPSPVVVSRRTYYTTHSFSLYSFLLEKKRPDLVRKMVAIDVGGALQNTTLGFMCIVSYHLWLIAAFVLGGPIGDAMAQFFAWLVRAPAHSNVARASMCYPYYQFWKSRLSKEDKSDIKDMLPVMPGAPLLFLYGVAGPKAVLVRKMKDKYVG